MRRGKKKSGFVPAAIILILLALVVVLLGKFVFVIRNVQVGGTANISAQEIARAAALDYGSSIFLVSEDKIRHNIDSLGSIELVSVKKKLPWTVVIEVDQRRCAAAVVHQNEIVQLDENGYVIDIGKRLPAGSVYFSGVHIVSCRVGSMIMADAGQVELMSAIVRAINKAGAARYVKEVDIERAQDIRITCVNNTKVTVGDGTNIDNKIAWMTAAITDLTQRGQNGGRLDVSSGTKADYNGPIVTEEK